MNRNTTLRTISTLLLISTFFFFQACETDIQGEVKSQINQSHQVDPTLLSILRNPPAFVDELGVSNLRSRTEDNPSSDFQEQLLSEFVYQFQDDEMLEHFLQTKGVPNFSLAYTIGGDSGKNMSTIPVSLNGELNGTVHHVYDQNKGLVFVDYISLQHSQNLLLTDFDYVGSNQKKYLRVTAHAQYVASLIVGQPMGDQYFEALEVLNSKIESTTELTSRTEECEGELLTISIYTGSLEVIANPDGSVTLPGVDCPLCTATEGMQTEVICVQTGGNLSGGGTGTVYGTTDGPNIPTGLLASPYGSGGGESDPNGGGCSDGGSNSNPGGHMGGDGNGDEGGAEDPWIVEARYQEAIQRMQELNELIPLQGAGACIIFNTPLTNAMTLAAQEYGGLVTCHGETSEDRLRGILSSTCYGGGCAQLFRDNIEQSFGEGSPLEWIDVSTSVGASYIILSEIENSTGVSLDCDTKSFLAQSLEAVQQLEAIVANSGMSSDEKAYALQAAIEEHIVPTVYLPDSEEWSQLFLTSFVLQKKNPSWPKWKVIAVAYSKVIVLGQVHTLLDLVGLVPGIGEPADGLNGVIYVFEGDYVNAGISFGALIPLLSVGPGGRIVKKVFQAVKTATGGTSKLILKRTADGFLQFCSTGPTSCRGQLARILGPIADHEAHHIIPVHMWDHPKIQQLAERGVFHMNDKSNGLMIHNSQHSGSHPAYDQIITDILENTNISNLNARLIQLKNEVSLHILNGGHITTFTP